MGELIIVLLKYKTQLIFARVCQKIFLIFKYGCLGNGFTANYQLHK